MSTLREAAQQALEALEMSKRFVYADNRPQCDEAIDALRAALAQQAETMAQEAAQEALQGADVLAEYSGQGEARQWASTGAWLYPGERIVVLRGGRRRAAGRADSNPLRHRRGWRV